MNDKDEPASDATDGRDQPPQTAAALHRQNEVERQILLDFSNLVNTPNSTHDLLREVTRRLQEWSGCQAVGIRLRDGEDFPYFETRGFAPEFLLTENHLCAMDSQGELIRDSRGDPVLECMCGSVLRGRVDPSLPRFTAGGSFWTNSTTHLLSTTGKAKHQAPTRNHCNGKDYESVALIPLWAMGRPLGLLQFCDARKGMFDTRRIALFERLASELALGLIQRQTADALRKSEQRQRQIIHDADTAYFHIDLEGRFREVNAAWLRLHKYDSADEIIGQHFSVTQTASDLPRAMEIVECVCGGESVRTGDFSRRCKDGSVGYHSFSVRPVVEADRIVGMEGFLIDTTQHRQAEETLRQSEETYRALVAGLPDIVIRFDRQGRHLFVSENVQEVVDLQAGQFIGKTHRELGFAEAECRFWEDTIRHVFDHGSPYETEFRSQGKRGATIYNWRLVPEFDARHQVCSVLSISRDITAQRRAERSYQTLFQQMHDGFALHEIVCDASGRPNDYRFLEVNPAFERLTGLCASDVIGRTVREVMPGIEAHWIERYGQVALTGHPVHFEDFFRELGRWYHISAYCPQPGQFAVFFLDVTDRHTANAERLEMERRLLHAQRLESLGVLAGGIAHDFNNLLTVILGQVDFALRRIPATIPVRPNLEEAVRAARRAADLTRQMLAYSGKGNFILEPVDLAALVEENAHLFRTVVPRTITMTLRLDRNVPPIQADRGQLQQVVMNLITNAAEAIGGNPGSITLSAGVQQHDGTSLRCSRTQERLQPGRYVCLTVSDTGCGMDGPTQERLFDPFFTTKFAGRGLGMSVVMGIVKGHQGAILADSTPGRGTTIRILFPVPKETGGSDACVTAPTVPATGPSATAPSAGLILVVDDEQPVRNLCQAMLESLGFAVVTAANGQEGLEVFRKQEDRIVCVILDLSMPLMDGRATLVELHRIRPGVKVLLASGYSETEVIGLPAGQSPAGFLQKPFALDDLEAAVRKAIAKVD